MTQVYGPCSLHEYGSLKMHSVLYKKTDMVLSGSVLDCPPAGDFSRGVSSSIRVDRPGKEILDVECSRRFEVREVA